MFIYSNFLTNGASSPGNTCKTKTTNSCSEAKLINTKKRKKTRFEFVTFVLHYLKTQFFYFKKIEKNKHYLTIVM